jgi:hypothetical protein
MFGRPPTNFGPPGPFPGPGPFPPFYMQPPKTGGFLSKLFGGAAGPRLGGFGGAPSSNLFGMMNPGGGQGFLGTIQNVEKMIQLAQTVKPMIDQYGPMVKNIPSMLDLLKEYKAHSSEQEPTTTNNIATNPTNKTSNKATNKKEINQPISEPINTENNKKQSPKGIKVVPKKANINQPTPKRVQYKTSTPKLYI